MEEEGLEDSLWKASELSLKGQRNQPMQVCRRQWHVTGRIAQWLTL